MIYVGVMQIPGRDRDLFISPSCPDQLWAHPASFQMGTGGSFPAGKVARAWSYTFTPLHLHDMVYN